MADTDLIACLCPFEDNSGSTKGAIEGVEQAAVHSCPGPKPKVQYGRRDRVPTEEPEQRGACPLDSLPRLELRFSQPPKTWNGYVAGCDKNSDIVLP
jgi:hypothetical protein